MSAPANHPLHVDVFRALLAIGWIDGELGEAEADAILRAAREEGLEEYTVEELRAASKAPLDFGEIDVSALSSADRLYIYAVSSWIAQVDGEVLDVERSALHAVATLLGITGLGRQEMNETVTRLAAREDAPDRLDLRGLRDAIAQRLQHRA